MDEKNVSMYFEKSQEKAREIYKDADKVERVLLRAEEKLKTINVVGEGLSKIPALISMIRSYIRKEYTELPVGSLIAAIGAIIYFVSPVDIIPDVVPALGVVDDAAVIVFACNMIFSDINDYIAWRDQTGQVV